jgi:hypothetical protein
MHDPRSGHVDVVYRILRYLKSSPEKGIIFKSHRHMKVESFCYADRYLSLFTGSPDSAHNL